MHESLFFLSCSCVNMTIFTPTHLLELTIQFHSSSRCDVTTI